MINNLEVSNFKCFQKSQVFEFAELNLLTGINGRGKSSIFQIFLLLSQSSWDTSGLLDELILNGDLIRLGSYIDIKNSETNRQQPIEISISAKEKTFDKIQFQFVEHPTDEFIALTHKIQLYSPGKSNIYTNEGLPYPFDEVSNDLLGLLEEIHYVSADRMGPVKYIEKKRLPEFVTVGSRGENTINILSYPDLIENVYEPLYLGKDASHLLQQTQEWLSYILEGAKIKIEGREATSSVLTMLLNNRNTPYDYKPTNVGFGYSYILPIIVTGLIAEKGQTIFIENPEAHLHPRAQSRIAEFLTRVASCGIQVFIESHSEHILNGLRVSTLNPKIQLSNNNFNIHYFKENFEAEKLVMDAKGKIEKWPEGFFDQQEIDIAEIFKYSRKE